MSAKPPNVQVQVQAILAAYAWTPLELAKMLGVALSSVYNWISGNHPPKGLSLEVLQALDGVRRVLDAPQRRQLARELSSRGLGIWLRQQLTARGRAAIDSTPRRRSRL